MSRKSSHRWLQEHHADPYVKQAQQAGYRSRAVYKLAQIDTRDHLFWPGMTIVELGAAPGGWSQWVTQRLSNQVNLWALDILPMAPLPNVTFIQGDFREPQVFEELLRQLQGQPVHLVMSDMSPNLSGEKLIDQPRMMLLADLAKEFSFNVLSNGGQFLTKIFQGAGSEAYLKALKPHFKQVVIRKPPASKSRSSEIYVLAKNYQKP